MFLCVRGRQTLPKIDFSIILLGLSSYFFLIISELPLRRARTISKPWVSSCWAVLALASCFCSRLPSPFIRITRVPPPLRRRRLLASSSPSYPSTPTQKTAYAFVNHGIHLCLIAHACFEQCTKSADFLGHWCGPAGQFPWSSLLQQDANSRKLHLPAYQPLPAVVSRLPASLESHRGTSKRDSKSGGTIATTTARKVSISLASLDLLVRADGSISRIYQSILQY